MLRDRLPPQNAEAEEAVIGSLLIDNDSYVKVAAFLKPEDFAYERTKLCYETCRTLFDRNVAINQVTVAHELAVDGQLENIGGAAYLAHVLLQVPTSAHIEHYARIVHRSAVMRHLIDAAGEIAQIGYEAGPDVDAALTQAEDKLFGLRKGTGDRGFMKLEDILAEYLAQKDEARSRPDAPAYIPTGFFDLDKLLGGLQRSDLVILAARPGVGKSSLALNMAYHAAKHFSAHVAIFSLEMGKEQLADRLLSSITKIDSYKLQQFRTGQSAVSDEETLMGAIGDLSEVPIWIDDTSGATVGEMRSKARRLYMEKGLDLIIVDYLQLMHGQGNWTNNRVQEVSEISRSLKALARDLDVPLIAISALNRGLENRPNHRPQLSDLRESGAIEQDADIVIFIHREDARYTEEEWERTYPDKPFPQGLAEIIVAKHRHGPVGQIQLYFDKTTTSFKNALAKR